MKSDFKEPECHKKFGFQPSENEGASNECTYGADQWFSGGFGEGKDYFASQWSFDNV